MARPRTSVPDPSPSRPPEGVARSRAAAAALAAVMLAALLVMVTPAGAATGSIVYTKDHNVWIMPAGGTEADARPVTTDGTPDRSYRLATQDDTGRIVAVLREGTDRLVRMDQNGNRLGEPFTPNSFAYVDELALNPSGEVVAFTDAGPCDVAATYFWCFGVDFAYADGSDSSDISNFLSFGLGASWLDDRQVVMYYIDPDAETQGRGLFTFSLGDNRPQPWFDTCPGFAGEDSFEYLCDTAMSPQVTRAHDRLVYSVLSDDPEPTRMRVFDLVGGSPPPSAFDSACQLDGPPPADFGEPSTGQLGRMSWSPDGDGLVWELGELNEVPVGAGIYRATGFATGCGQAFATAQLIVPGGHGPSWGPAPVGAAGPGAPDPGVTGIAFDGDPATTQRVDRGDGVSAAIEVSRLRFPEGGRGASHVVLSRDDTFPDSLAGASLTAGGPLLFTSSATLTAATSAEVDRLLSPGDVVYLLGGPGAIGPAVQASLESSGYQVRRLAGPSRVETALAVADEVRRLYPEVDTVAVARAFGAEGSPTSGWADSVTGGGYGASAGVPIIITPTDGVHAAVAAWLAVDGPGRTLLLGGTAALSDAVAGDVPNPQRVAGAERQATAASIATTLWQAADSGPRRFAVVNGQHEQGWMFGLAVGGLAADAGAPVLLVGHDDIQPPTAQLVGACGTPEVDLLLMGSASVISEGLRSQLDDLDGGRC